MRVILIGYGAMLRALTDGVLNSKHKIAGVFLHENVKNSGLKNFINHYLNPSADYLYAKSRRLHLIKADSVNSDKFRQAVKDLKADAVITGSWSEKFSMQTINTIPNGFINVHPSLLPKYRGPNPYMQAVLHNERISGVTFHLMDVNYDTGAVLYQKEVRVMPKDTGGSLKMRCCIAAKAGIAELLDNFEEKILNSKSQTESESSYQSAVSVKEAVLEFQKENVAELDRRIRALSPWLKCYIPFKNEFFSFEKYEITKQKTKKPAGEIVNKTHNSVYIACLEGSVMKFSNLKINRPFSKYLSKFFWDKMLNIKDKAV